MEQGIDNARFGAFVARLRKEKGLTQRQLAELVGVSDKAVSKWERGLSLPDISLLEPLADALGVTVAELLHGERLDAPLPGVQRYAHLPQGGRAARLPLLRPYGAASGGVYPRIRMVPS